MAEEILYVKANIDDINRKLDELDKRLDKTERKAGSVGDDLSGGMNKGAQATEKATTALKKQDTQTSSMIKGFKSLAGAIGIAFATRAIINFAKESVELAKKAEGIEKAFGKIDKAGLLQELRSATQGAVSDLELMQDAVSAKNLGVPIERLGVLFQFAAQRAAETGQSVSKLKTDIVTGLGTKSTDVLNNLGISAESVRKGLKGVSIQSASVKQLTESLADTLESQLDPAFNGSASSADKLSVIFDNVSLKVGKALLPAFDETTNILFEISNALLGVDFSDAFDPSQIEGFNAALTKVTGNLLLNNAAALKGVTTYAEFQREIEGLATANKLSSILLSESAEEITEFLEKQSKAYIVAGGNSKTYKDFIIAVQDRLKSLTETTDETTESQLGLIDSLKEQIKLQDDLLGKATTQIAINKIIDKRNDLEIQLNAILNQRKNLIDDGQDEDDTAAFFAREGAKLDKLKEVRKKEEDIADDAIEQARKDQEKIDQDAKDSSDFKINLANEEAEAQLQAANYMFGQLQSLFADNAEAAKTFAVFQSVINTFQAITKALAEAGPIAGPILAAGIGALGFANVAKIASTPVPQYFEGTDYLNLNGNKDGRDTIPIYANKGEAIIRTDRNAEAPGLAKSWNSGNLSKWVTDNLDRYITVDHVLPMIEKVQSEKRIFEGRMISGKGSTFSDGRIVSELKRSRKVNEAMIELLANQRVNYNPYRA